LFILLIASMLSQTGNAQITPPEPPEITRITIDTSIGLPVIHWNASSSDDVEKYTMYYFITDNQGQWYPIPTLDTLDINSRQYTYNSLIPDDSLSLTIAAIDAAGTPSVFTSPHTTMYLTSVYDSCTKTTNLSWTPYLGWPSVVRYEIYVSIDNGSYTLLKEIDGDSLTVNHYSIEDNHKYCYFIEAVKADNLRSTSNIDCRDVRHAIHPGFIDIEYVSVDTGGANIIDLAFYIDPSGEVNDFQLFRARPGTPYAGQQIFTDISSEQFTYSDEVAGTDRQYIYKLFSLDVCLNAVTGSDPAGNIVLNAESAGLNSMLHWNAYDKYEAGVKNYHIYRITNQQEKELVVSLSPQDTTYTDDLGMVTGTTIQDNVCYYVEAEENDSYSRGMKGISRSNTLCISVVPEILMANAFTPNNDGFNDEIKPVLTFIPEKYLYQVFDRWGSLVFETTNPQTAWDGMIKGKSKATTGVYIFYIKLTTTSGIEVEQNGQITVFYP
jgi:gliding motility-associated-like protein